MGLDSFDAYARALAQGYTPWKGAVRVVATVPILLQGEQTHDGVALEARADSVLATAQTDPRKNGIYVVQRAEWTRREDADRDLFMPHGTRIPVVDGSYRESVWRLTTTGSIKVDSTALEFELDAGTGGGIPGGIVIVGATRETVLTGPVIMGARYFAPGPGTAHFRAVLQATTGMTARARLLDADGTVLATLTSTSVAEPEMKEAVLAALPSTAAVYIVDLTISVGSPTVNDRAIVHSAVVDFN